MKTKYLHCLIIFVFTFLLSSTTKGQSLTLVANTSQICLGSQLNLNASITNIPAGITAINCTFDFNNDGTVDKTITNGGPNYTTQHQYTTAGNYTIKAEVNLSNSTKVSRTISIVVNRLPIPSTTLNSQTIQCFKGNSVRLTNSSIKTDNRILMAELNWGDSSFDSYSNPFSGQIYSHAYSKSGQFNVSLKVTDSIGCSKDSILHVINIRPKINPSFNVIGSAGCFCTPYMLQNTTTQVPFSQVNSYKWDFGDGQTLTRSRPWNLPQDQYKYDTIWHTYCKNGTFFPSLTIQDINGCVDTFSITKESSSNKPRNIVVELNPIPYLSISDTTYRLRRDSVCFDKEGLKTLVFVQKPNPEIDPSNGELLWNFGDPSSQQNNFNQNSWNPSHTFTRGLGAYNVNLQIWPLQPNQSCKKDTTIVVEVLGPRARIEDPQNQITLNPTEQNQCNPNASGYYNAINFVNTAQSYKSNRVFRRWDFADDIAPQCTSYLVPKAGYPPTNGWATSQDQYNFSNGYWRQGGRVYQGKRLDCRYSNDTLPIHRYTSWDVIYKWYRYGHDFMPWNPTQYSKNPADTLPTANPRKTLIHPDDTLWWGKPVYLNPNTGVWSLTQGSGPAPYGLWPRIDTIKSVDEKGQVSPLDLKPYNRFILQNGAPDPLAGFWGNTKRGGYGFFPKGFVVDPLNDSMLAKYTSIKGESFRHSYERLVEPSKTLYRYLFEKAIQKCHQVSLFLQDSQNNVGKKTHLVVNDFTKLDTLDCSDEDQVQIKLMRPDATGLGVRGKECPGSYTGPDQAGIQFMLGNVDNTLGQYPGISPDCGASWIRINLDSMADRRDQTPCALDGFINYTGATGPAPQAGGQPSTTPGGLNYPPFSLQPDYNQYFMPPNRWNAPGGTNFWYHYGSNVNPLQVTQSGITLFPPANPTGDITIGLIVGTGDPNNPCISDTVWYHNLLNITDLDGRFYVDPIYAPITNIPTNGACKYYSKNDIVNFVYLDSLQPFIRSSTIDWGDNSITVDSFFYSPNPSLTNNYFVNGFRRVRYNYYFGSCGEKEIGSLVDSIPFPNGIPGTSVSYRYIDNYTMRIYNATNNPNGSLLYVGKVPTNDSTIWEECGTRFRVANTDTLKVFYRKEVMDRAIMLLPVTHRYWSSTYEVDCKRSGSTPRAISHQLMSTKECRREEMDYKLLVRGVIDSVMSRDAKGNFDDVFCKNEPVHFYDSVRYYRKDCSLSDPLFNPNFDPRNNTLYDAPFNTYHYDTVNYWRDGSVNVNEYHPNGDFIEKVKYYFGDGDSAMWTNPIHKYKQAGAYTVTMLSRDKNGSWDTAYCKVTITGLTNSAKAGFTINKDSQCIVGNQFILKDTTYSPSLKYSRTWIRNNIIDTPAQLNLTYPAPGNYPITLKVIFNDGCSDSVSKTLSVSPSPKVGFTINNSSQCENNNLFILSDTTKITSGTFNRTWSWDNNTSNLANLNTSFNTAGVKSIKLKAVSNNGCSDSVTKNVTVLSKPNIGTIAGSTNGVNTQQTYDYNLNQQLNHSYSWSLTNGNIISGQGTNAIKVQWLSPGIGKLNAVINNNVGCSDSASLNVSIVGIGQAPVITSFTPQNGNNGTLITINGSNLNGASAVLFGGINAKSFNVASASVITATVDTGATGNVSVVTPNGTALLSGFTYNGSTGITEFLTQSYSIFPNPVHSEIIIESDKTLNNASFELMDLNGKVLMSTTCNTPTNRLTLDVKTLSPAVYLLRITSQGQTSTVKVIKQ